MQQAHSQFGASAHSRFLSKPELKQLTGYTWKSRQQSTLGELGIEFVVNPRGEIVVDWSTVSLAQMQNAEYNSRPRFDRVVRQKRSSRDKKS